jgi:hypothetical protein
VLNASSEQKEDPTWTSAPGGQRSLRVPTDRLLMIEGRSNIAPRR